VHHNGFVELEDFNLQVSCGLQRPLGSKKRPLKMSFWRAAYL
jgi:hypothetical protein